MRIKITENQLKKTLKFVVTENLQMADKLFFSSGLLSNEERDEILKITNGDYTTNLITKIYHGMKDSYSFTMDSLKSVHNMMLSYNRNVFPIKGFDFNNKDVNYYQPLIDRYKTISLFTTFPSIAKRNLKNDIRQERDGKEMSDLYNTIEYISGYLKYLDNRDDESKMKIMKKIFKSNHDIKDISRFVDDKDSLLGGKDLTREKILEIIEDPENDSEVIYDNENVMVVKIMDVTGIKNLGCNSLWCFTYGNDNYRQWYEYSHNGIIYAIIDFKEQSDSPDFMHVLIKPLQKEYEEDADDYPLYNMSNENYYNPYSFLEDHFSIEQIREIFTFDEEPDDDEDDYYDDDDE